MPERMKIKPGKITGIRPGFPGTARQGRCAVKSVQFFFRNKPQNTYSGVLIARTDEF
jgi:hypothetical protein